eukprot:m.176482 g.176482  ORF g.176482 m.176482 type:complete len:360 (+) comp21388_c0_seq1:572-1651(+)
MPVSFCKRLVSSRLAQSPWQSLEKLISSGSVLIFTRCINSFQAFAALRDGHITSDPAIESRRSLYTTTIFPTLAKAGVASATLTLAWDFTVMSTTAQTGRMMSMREDAFARTSGGIDYVVVKKTDKPQRNVARRIDGEMRAPWYLNQGEAGQGARLVLDPTNPNRAVNNGEKWIPFVVMIPEAVANGSVVGHPMSYGHGLFGDRTEIFEDFLVEEANTYGYVVFATDWLGMCKEDEVALALMISESLTNFAMVPDRLVPFFLFFLLCFSGVQFAPGNAQRLADDAARQQRCVCGGPRHAAPGNPHHQFHPAFLLWKFIGRHHGNSLHGPQHGRHPRGDCGGRRSVLAAIAPVQRLYPSV